MEANLLYFVIKSNTIRWNDVEQIEKSALSHKIHITKQSTRLSIRDFSFWKKFHEDSCFFFCYNRRVRLLASRVNEGSH